MATGIGTKQHIKNREFIHLIHHMPTYGQTLDVNSAITTYIMSFSDKTHLLYSNLHTDCIIMTCLC